MIRRRSYILRKKFSNQREEDDNILDNDTDYDAEDNDDTQDNHDADHDNNDTGDNHDADNDDDNTDDITFTPRSFTRASTNISSKASTKTHNKVILSPTSRTHANASSRQKQKIVAKGYRLFQALLI